MDGWLLQDLVTIAGNVTGNVTSVPQSVSGYLEVGEHEDLFIMVDVRNFTVTSGTISITVETSPSRDEASFVPLVAGLVLAAPGVFVQRAPFATAYAPAARYVRWRASAGGGAQGYWDVTFRVWVSAYAYA